MGIMVYSLLWVVQDFVHQPYQDKSQSQSSSVLILFLRFLYKHKCREPSGAVGELDNVIRSQHLVVRA